MYKNVLDYFSETVNRFPEKTAIIHNEESITFLESLPKTKADKIDYKKLENMAALESKEKDFTRKLKRD